MARVFSQQVISAIDIGTTKICVLIARYQDNEHIEIIGIGKAPSHGLKKGVVVDVAQTIRSIRTAIKEAELMAGITVDAACIGISGGHIQSINSHGVIPIKKGIVRQADMAHALAAAQAIPINEGMQILHVLPQYYIIDSRDVVQDPCGMHGIRLEVQAHIILGAIACVQNLITCCEMAGVRVTDIILEQLASADAVLSVDERELGVAMLDIGGGTSDLAIFHQGSIRHTMVLPVAGNHLTNDIAIGLRITMKEAERIKKEYGIAHAQFMTHDDFIETEMIHENQRQVIQVSDLVRIIQPRIEELLALINHEFKMQKLAPYLTTGLVLTGGGSLLIGIKDLAEQLFHMPVRVGYPKNYALQLEVLQNPTYATACGLIIHALKKQHAGLNRHEGALIKRIVDHMKTWITDFF